MSTAEQDRTASAELVLDNHRVVRDGSAWLCVHCKRTWLYPSPLPDGPGPCVPRTWGEMNERLDRISDAIEAGADPVDVLGDER